MRDAMPEVPTLLLYSCWPIHANYFVTPLRVPKKIKKGKQQQKAAVVTDQTADDFDDMLAELRAADLTAPALSTTSSNSTSSMTSSASNTCTTSSTAQRNIEDATGGEAQGMQVSEAVIMHAIERGDVTTLRRCSRRGLLIVSADTLCSAVVSGNIAVIQCLVKELGASVNKEHPGHGLTPLIIANWCASWHLQNLKLVRFMAKELGADVNLATEDGDTPLIAAAQRGHVDVVRCLVTDFGADIGNAGNVTCTPLLAAVHEGHLDVMRLLVNELCADVNKSTHKGVTPLFMAAEEGCLDVVRCLVEEFGADVKQATNDGRTPLMAASHGKHAKVIKFLIKLGADAQASSVYGTAATISQNGGAPAVQTDYLEAKAHCSNPSCGGAGLKKCTGCK
jgi:ankyrin repeat protein